ncbi:hypothetical protein [Undibacterium sp. Ji49W]|uniref:hypothetical protein n=1 Tax=Undibacterium sp. Ji49W TaxID=3413040 RepID=UPI003BF33F1B
MSLFSNWIFIGFFVFGIGYLWLKTPAIPVGSGEKARWIKYESNASAWVKRAGMYTLLCLAVIVLDLLRMSADF